MRTPCTTSVAACLLLWTQATSPNKPRTLIRIDRLRGCKWAREGASCEENRLSMSCWICLASAMAGQSIFKGMLRTLLVALELALHSHVITKPTQLFIPQHGHHGESPAAGHVCICGRDMRHPKNPCKPMSIDCLLWSVARQSMSGKENRPHASGHCAKCDYGMSRHGSRAPKACAANSPGA